MSKETKKYGKKKEVPILGVTGLPNLDPASIALSVPMIAFTPAFPTRLRALRSKSEGALFTIVADIVTPGDKTARPAKKEDAPSAESDRTSSKFVGFI